MNKYVNNLTLPNGTNVLIKDLEGRTNLSNEIRRATAKETELEESDTHLRNDLTTETNARKQGDTALQTKIDHGVLKVEKLWQNSSVSSPFLPQTINLDLSKYKFVIIWFKLATDALQVECFATLSFTGNISVTPVYQSYGGTSGGFMAFRELGYVKTTGINFGDGKKATSLNAYSNNNNLLIPYTIYGVR